MMVNPFFNAQNGNPMQMIMDLLSSGNNPQQMIQSLASQNPQLQAIMNQMTSSGMTPRDFVLQYAKQNNVNIQPLINMMNQRGIKM